MKGEELKTEILATISTMAIEENKKKNHMIDSGILSDDFSFVLIIIFGQVYCQGTLWWKSSILQSPCSLVAILLLDMFIPGLWRW